MQKIRFVHVADILLLLVAFFWGTSYSIAKESISFYPILGFLALRFLLTFFILSPIFFKRNKADLKKDLKIGIKLGFILFCIFLCETYGVLYTTASNAPFLISLFIIFTPFMEWTLLKQRPNNKLLIASFLCLLGVYFLTYQKSWHFNYGDFLILLAAILRALMVCMTKILTKDRYTSALSLTAIQSGIVGLACLTLGLLLMPSQLLVLPSAITFWGNTLYLVLFCTIFAFFAQNWAVQHTSPTHTSLLMGTEPLFGALFATLWLQEQLTLLAWLGGIIIVATCVWLTWPSSTKAALAN